MLHIVLFEPEIPPNTGNVIRLCANTGATLHLIEPLGFNLDNKQVKRAGLDYHDLACVITHKTLAAFQKQIRPNRIIAFSTKGKTNYSEIKYQDNDALLFGPETRGLPADILSAQPKEQIARLPMLPTVRSLNLSNTVAVALYEAWRQLGFNGYS
ncbi:MAG: tRNA (uridine(34)/cytosine(34)/5-carboxymethylaminomethyluridine(34)-2'-O)-methyltransferase TrmL [Gammaproteobacteria bacterium]|nr:tRNA (uridine(34)/cytosine(34)/5-carboxymethylaminomethyluridine(34)-2'-O)-methyltransferase TrmL [Gammaproteobacteria bacterium]